MKKWNNIVKNVFCSSLELVLDRFLALLTREKNREKYFRINTIVDTTSF
jgi:hypothetical protein